MVTTPAALAEMIDHLKAAGSFAFDSEFIGERSYEPLVCLVQAATSEKVFLVDPLAGLDLSSLWELLVCPAVEKIVLAGQQDFTPAALKTLRPPANVMDVQIAAGFVHVDYPLSLAKLIQEFVAVPLGKAPRSSQWDRRPLSAMQVSYAADDVRYLLAARDAIGKRLTELGCTAWAREECANAIEDLSLYRPAPEMLYLRVKGRDRLGRQQLAVLRELTMLRDQAARQANLPARTLLPDGILLALARRPIRHLDDLDAVRGLPRPVEVQHGQQILDATAKALSLGKDQLPPPGPIEDPALRERVDEIWARMGQFCQERSIAPALVASRKEITRLCVASSRGLAAGEHRLLRGWRKELLGALLEQML
jgi:ribonuclease D